VRRPLARGAVVRAHRASARAGGVLLRAAIVTASDTRTRADDASGDVLAHGLEEAGVALVDRRIARDEAPALVHAIRAGLAAGADVVLVTGGTGVAPRDVTPEALDALGVRPLPGFGELFRALSFAEIGPAAMLSRAAAGSLGGALVFALPGSPDACRLALTRLILPELPHLVAQLRRPHPEPPRGPSS
jgi:molybdenum cofactor biosynthesis protein B